MTTKIWTTLEEKFQKMNPIEHFKQTGKLYDYKPSYSK